MFKKTCTIFVALMFSSSLALASWDADFVNRTHTNGLPAAVTLALGAGAVPFAIMKEGLALTGITPQDLICAMYMASMTDDEIKTAAKENGISEAVVLAGYKQSLDPDNPLLDDNNDTQAYTFANPGTPVANVRALSPISPAVSFSGPTEPPLPLSVSAYTF